MFILEGLAEGLVGAHKVAASSVDDLFAQYPSLQTVRGKLIINGQRVSGFAACDG